MDGLNSLAKRPMRVKIIYTFDKAHAMVCLARSACVIDVPVVPNEDDGAPPVGVVDIAQCLQTVCRSSPEILATDANDYVVYSKDLSENLADGVFVGHGFLSSLLSKEANKTTKDEYSGVSGNDENQSQNQDEEETVYAMGKVSKNLLPLYAAETLEVHLRLTPVLRAQQSHYVESLKNYRSLAALEPPPAPRRSLTVADLEASVSLAKRQRTVPTSYYSQYLASSSPPSQTDYPSSSGPRELGRERTINTNSQSTSTLARAPSGNHRVLSVGSAESKPIRKAEELLESDLSSYSDELDTDSSDSPPVVESTTSTSTSTSTNVDVNTPNSTETNSNKNKRARRQQYKIDQRLVEALATGKVPKYCENCGCIRTATWRRFKSKDDDFTLCNPCGLWYSAKKIMRPKKLWGTRKGRKTEIRDINTYLADEVNKSHHEQPDKEKLPVSSPVKNIVATLQQQAADHQRSVSSRPISQSSPTRKSSTSACVTPTAFHFPMSDPPHALEFSGLDSAFCQVSDVVRLLRTNESTSSASSSPRPHTSADISEHDHKTAGNKNTSELHSDPLTNIHHDIERKNIETNAHHHHVQDDSLHFLEEPETIHKHTCTNKHSDEPQDESNKENIPPAPMSPPVTSDHLDIEALFMTPKKKSPTKNIDIGSITPASRWLSKFIQQQSTKFSEEDDIFKAFMESPSRKYTDHFSAAMTSFDDAMLNSEATHDTVPSSPPPSFFYHYEEESLKQKQLGSAGEDQHGSVGAEDADANDE